MKTTCWRIGSWLALAMLLLGCGDPATLVGQFCQRDEHCGSEQGIELSCDRGIPGGACTAIGCTPDDPLTEALEDQATCPAGSRCRVEPQGTYCRPECEALTDCREVLACTPVQDCQEPDGCGEECTNAMTCETLDPQAAPDGEEEEPARVCVFSGS